MINRWLLTMVREAGTAANPGRALRRLLQICVDKTSASSGRLYLLNLASSAYVRVCQVGGGDAAESYPVDLLEPGAKPRSVVEWVIMGRDSAPKPPSHGQGSRLVMPIKRGATCLGFIDLEADREGYFTGYHEEIVEFAAEVALSLADKQYTLRLLRTLPEPIKLNQPFDKFLDDLVELIAAASGMPFIALRELIEPATLQCLASYGFEDQDMASLTIAPLSEYDSFQKAIATGQPVVEPTMRAPHLAALQQKPQLARVRSFVLVPVKVGEELFGTLSFSAACEYEYTDLEVWGFQTIANAIGVSISNYRAGHDAADNLYKAAQVDSAITSLEIAQAARHEIIDRTAEGTEAALVIRDTVSGSPTREDLQRVRKKTDEISSALLKITQVINNIKTVTKPPVRDWQKVSMRKLWEETFGLFHGRLATLGIKHTIAGDAEAEVVPDYLRHVFLHLLLNSVDAFKERRQKSNRLITVTLNTQSDQAVNVHIRYTDNATGIDPSRLLGLPPSEAARAPVPADVFLPGVTSKAAQGSGYGLYLANKILKDHKGTLTLVDNRNGVVFDIFLPKVRPQRGKGKVEEPKK